MSTISSGILTPIAPIARNFPTSTASPSTLFKYPGTSFETTSLARKYLEENNRRFDIYGKRRFEHNHFPHSLLTRYALGAPPKLLLETWKYDADHLVSLDPRVRGVDLTKKDIPDRIGRDNWDDESAFGPYLAFFHEEIERLGPVEALRYYIFSSEANSGGVKNKKGPRMLIRLLSGVIHPFIHTGFGIEFKDRIVLAEGLAEAAVHTPDLISPLFPDNWPYSDIPPYTPMSNQSPPPSTGQWETSSNELRYPISGKSLLEIYAEFTKDPALYPGKYDPNMLINDRLRMARNDGRDEGLRRLGDMWSLSDLEVGDDENGWKRKMEEIGVLTTFLTCATGRRGRVPRLDFFLMHTLTSSIFLPSFLPLLSLSERRILLRSYLLVVLHTALARGRPKIDPGLLMSYPANSLGPGSEKQPSSRLDVIGEPYDRESQNVWLKIVENSIYAHDSHVPKAIRSLIYHSMIHGNLGKGGLIGTYETSETSEERKQSIEGLAESDGTIFVRAAGMIMDVMGWTRDGQDEGEWDRSALGWDGAWEN